MFSIRYANNADSAFWHSLDQHLPQSEFERKVRDKMGYVISCGEEPVGVMRYNLFWDAIPFLTMIYFKDTRRGQGFGKQAMQHWESEMRSLGHKIVMTSTQADEDAQHFYRKIGYKDTGCLLMVIPEFEQPLEIFLIKEIRA